MPRLLIMEYGLTIPFPQATYADPLHPYVLRGQKQITPCLRTLPRRQRTFPVAISVLSPVFVRGHARSVRIRVMTGIKPHPTYAGKSSAYVLRGLACQ